MWFQSRPQTASYREATNQTRRLGFSEYTKRTRHNMLQLLAVLKYGRSVGLVRDRNGAAGASFVRPLAVCVCVCVCGGHVSKALLGTLVVLSSVC
jgi:hypothetical protein